MKLLIPKQSATEDSTTPSQPRELKKLLATLPNANMGELTKLVYQILRDLNRQPMPIEDRLQNMEMLKLPADSIFTHLKKYFINRTLPLPAKSKKIVNLNQALLQEITYGYKIILVDTLRLNNTDNKVIAKASYRTLHYFSELLLRCCEIYSTPPSGFWRDAHQIYLLCETKDLLNNNFIEKKDEAEIQVTIENIYKQLLLFILARPISLPQSDTDRVFHKLFNWAELCHIDKNDSLSKEQASLFCINLDADTPPEFTNEKETNATFDRTIDVSELLTHLCKTIDLSSNKEKSITFGDAISIETLKTLHNNWGTNAKRRFTRSGRKGNIDVAIGLSHITKRIIESKRLAQKRKPFEESSTPSFLSPAELITTTDLQFTLETIEEPKEDDSFEGYMTHTEINKETKTPWDAVASGTVLTETYAKEQERKQQEATKLNTHDDHGWEVVNFSAGGYRLRWNSDETSRAQIGELIALYEKVIDNNFQWRIGIIRWMQFTQENGLEVGVQVISPQTEHAKVNRTNKTNEEPFKCLLLPNIKALKQEASIILPAHAFKIDDKLNIKKQDNQCQIQLTSINENSGYFTQFYFSKVEDRFIKKKNDEANAKKNKDDFDEIWSTF